MRSPLPAPSNTNPTSSSTSQADLSFQPTTPNIAPISKPLKSVRKTRQQRQNEKQDAESARNRRQPSGGPVYNLIPNEGLQVYDSNRHCAMLDQRKSNPESYKTSTGVSPNNNEALAIASSGMFNDVPSTHRDTTGRSRDASEEPPNHIEGKRIVKVEYFDEQNGA